MEVCNKFLGKKENKGKYTDNTISSGNHTQVYDCSLGINKLILHVRFKGFFQNECCKCILIKSSVCETEYMSNILLGL